MEGLLTTKWVLEGSGDIVTDFTEEGKKKFVHETLPLETAVPMSGSIIESEIDESESDVHAVSS